MHFEETASTNKYYILVHMVVLKVSTEALSIVFLSAAPDKLLAMHLLYSNSHDVTTHFGRTSRMSTR